MNKRTWIYVHKPATYCITCDKCNGSNIEWSEFEHMIWCYDCKIDTKGTGGIFDGPIGLNVCELMGMSLDRYNIKRNRVESPRVVGKHIKYFAKEKRTA